MQNTMLAKKTAVFCVLLVTIYSSCASRHDGWELLFRAKSGNGQKALPAWLQSSDPDRQLLCPEACDVKDGCYRGRIDPLTAVGLAPEPETHKHLRSNIIDYWEEAKINKVKLALYKDGVEVAFVVFNAVGSSRMTWFDKHRLIETSWCDMSSNSRFSDFSLPGHHWKRTFHINKDMGRCDGQYGWLAVIETDFYCDWDVFDSYPQFLYALNGTVTQWGSLEFGKADVLAIFASRHTVPRRLH